LHDFIDWISVKDPIELVAGLQAIATPELQTTARTYIKKAYDIDGLLFIVFEKFDKLVIAVFISDD
jgi:hypothetical protein